MNEEMEIKAQPILIACSADTGITTATTTLVLDGTVGRIIEVKELYAQNIGSTTCLVQFKEESGAMLYEANLEENMPFCRKFDSDSIQLTEGQGVQIVTSATGDIRWTVGYRLFED